MRKWIGAVLVVLGVLVLGVPGPAAADDVPAAPAEAGPSITITPNTGLVDHQVVTVTGTGFGRHDLLSVTQCPTATPPDDCGFSFDLADTDASGSFSVDVGLRAVIPTASGSAVDCRPAPDTCSLSVRSWDTGEGASAPLTFDPTGPLAPPPTLAASPSTGLIDGQVIDVTGSGWRPGAQLFVFACAKDGPVDLHCPYGLFGSDEDRADMNGDLDTHFRAFAVIDVEGGPVDCRQASCFVTAGDPPFSIPDQPTVPLEFDPDAPLADPQLTVDPTTDLVDRQEISIHGTGWYPDIEAWIALCRAGDYDEEGGCRNAFAAPQTRSDGSLEATFDVRQEFTTFDGTHVDCTVEACAIFAKDFHGHTLQVPIAFAVAATPPVGPATPVAVEPRFTG